MVFDANLALRHVRDLSIPRKVGSPGESKTVECLYAYFKSLGYSVKTQNFFFPFFTVYWLPKLINLALLSAIFLQLIFWKILPIISVIFSSLTIIFLFFLIACKHKLRNFTVGKNNLSSKNIIAEKKTRNTKANLIFLAHYDSISQTFPQLFGAIFKFLAFCGTGIISGVIIALWLLKIEGDYLLFLCYFSFTVQSALILLIFNSISNKSVGVVDNASGLGVLLELARCLKISSYKDINFTFLATGAEELGLIGAREYIKEYSKEYDKSKTYFINLDCVGAEDEITIIHRSKFFCPVRKRLYKFIIKIGKENKLKIKKGWFLGREDFDHRPFTERNFEAITLLQCNMKKLLFCIHSRKDKFNNIKIQNLAKIGEFCLKIAEKIKKRVKHLSIDPTKI